MEIDSNWFLQLVVAINVGNGKTKVSIHFGSFNCDEMMRV